MPENSPVIGDFRKTPNNTERQVKNENVPAPQAEEALPAVEKPESTVAETVAAMKAAEAAEAALTPIERYQKRLRDANITSAFATTIYDGVLSKGYYEEYVTLTKTVRAVFRTRLYEDLLRIQTELEMAKPTLAITQDELITRFNLAASLYEWQGKKIPHETDEDFSAALRLVRRLPGPVFSLLATELMKFDNKIMTVFSEGAAANFS